MFIAERMSSNVADFSPSVDAESMRFFASSFWGFEGHRRKIPARIVTVMGLTLCSTILSDNYFLRCSREVLTIT